jgi:hypothetical protein
MQKDVKRKQAARRAAIKRDIAGPSYRRLERMAMRPDDSLFVAAVIASAALSAWVISIL